MSDFSFQLYSARNFPPLKSVLNTLGGLGYTQVEGYGALFAPELDLAALRADLDAAGLAMPTAHIGLVMIEGNPERVLDIVKTVGLKKVYVPHVAVEDRPSDAAGWKAFGARVEQAGQFLRDAGVGFGWHNHDFEFVNLPSGEVPQDLMLQGGASLEVELDIAWVVRGGKDPIEYIQQYGKRITAAHVKDIAPKGACVNEDGWADVGHGTMDWARINAALKAHTACEYRVMEHDNPSDFTRFATRSIASAKTL